MTAPRTVEFPEGFKALLGQAPVASDWFTVTQEHIDWFAKSTEDFQWIHVDPERAAAESPYGTTIAHGFMTLGLIAPLFESAIRIEGSDLGINYGLNRVRFTAPLPVNSRIRGLFTLLKYEELSPGLQLIWNVVIEVEGQEKPACVAEWVTRRFP